MTRAIGQSAVSMPWEFRTNSDGRIQRSAPVEAGRELNPGEVRLEFLAGGICGSDLGALADLRENGTDAESPIVPMHEITGRVTESQDDRFVPGQTVVGTGSTGLASSLIEQADHLIGIPPAFEPSDAIAIQPVSTVLRAARTLPPPGGDVVVIGTGSIGLAFIHILKRFGAHRVIAVDPVEGRSALARRYGADEFIGCTGQQWASEAEHESERPAIVIDAVGRRPEIITGALCAVGDGGFVLGFGSARKGDYSIPFGEMYHRRLTLASGRTRDGWRDVLSSGAEYLAKHREDFLGYVSNRLSTDEADAAYELCSQPSDERVKVVLMSTA